MSASVASFSSDRPEVLAEWASIQETYRPASDLCRLVEREFAEQYGLDEAKLAVRTGFGDDEPVGFFWPRRDKPVEWVWWKQSARIVMPRADKRGEPWRNRLRDVRRAYPKPRARMKERFGVPEYVGFVQSPGIALLDGEVWVNFGEKGTTEWDGGEWFRPRRLSEFYAAREAQDASRSGDGAT